MDSLAEEKRQMARILLDQADAIERDDYHEVCDECGKRLRWSDSWDTISPHYYAKLFPVIPSHSNRNYAVICCDKYTGTWEEYREREEKPDSESPAEALPDAEET